MNDKTTEPHVVPHQCGWCGEVTVHRCGAPSPQDLITRLRERARIRRQIPDRKSVQNGEPDRIADLLDEAAAALAASSPQTTPTQDDATIAFMCDAYRQSQHSGSDNFSLRGVMADVLASVKHSLRAEIAHDRQPYPTAWAYEQVCKARAEWQERAEKAEQVLRKIRDSTHTTAHVIRGIAAYALEGR